MVTLSLWWATFAACGLVLAGIGLGRLVEGLVVGYRSLLFVDEEWPEPQASAAPVEVHVVQAQAPQPEPALRHPGMPEPPADAEPLLFHAMTQAMFGPKALAFEEWPKPPEPVRAELEFKQRPHWDSWTGTHTGELPLVELNRLLEEDGMDGAPEPDGGQVRTARQRFTKRKPSLHRMAVHSS